MTPSEPQYDPTYLNKLGHAADEATYVGYIRAAGFTDVTVVQHTELSVSDILSAAGYDIESDAMSPALRAGLTGHIATSAIRAGKPAD